MLLQTQKLLAEVSAIKDLEAYFSFLAADISFQVFLVKFFMLCFSNRKIFSNLNTLQALPQFNSPGHNISTKSSNYILKFGWYNCDFSRIIWKPKFLRNFNLFVHLACLASFRKLNNEISRKFLLKRPLFQNAYLFI